MDLITVDAIGDRASTVLSELMAVNTLRLYSIREVFFLLRRVNGLIAANLWQLIIITIHLSLSSVHRTNAQLPPIHYGLSNYSDYQCHRFDAHIPNQAGMERLEQ